MDLFRLLPEGCVSDILSFTSPKDAAISSAISRGFNSAAESDLLWEKFLPEDYENISSRYVSPRICSSKKELYFSLCDSPVLMDGGKLIFRSGSSPHCILARHTRLGNTNVVKKNQICCLFSVQIGRGTLVTRNC